MTPLRKSIHLKNQNHPIPSLVVSIVFVARPPEGEDEDRPERGPRRSIVPPRIIHPRSNRIAKAESLENN